MNSIRVRLPSALRAFTSVNNHGKSILRFRYSTEAAAASPSAQNPAAAKSEAAAPTAPKRGPTPLENIQEPPMLVSTPTGQEKNYDIKISKIVDQISALSLLEVADLNELLKKRLNIPDTPMMGPMSFAAGPAAPAEEEEAAAPAKVQTSFTLKLLKYNDVKKTALIKECKSLLEGMNLVQAKKFVESAPTIVKADIPKDEAEKLAQALEAVGATCEIS